MSNSFLTEVLFVNFTILKLTRIYFWNNTETDVKDIFYQLILLDLVVDKQKCLANHIWPGRILEKRKKEGWW